MQVGFIGLGTMGSRMAANLQKAKHQMVVHDVRAAAAEPFLAAGAVWADNPSGVAERVEVIFTSLPGPLEVEAVAIGTDGLLQAMHPGSAYFDLSTNSPSVVRRLHAKFVERGIQMLDAPVSGGPCGAATGRLAIWASGERQTFERYRPLLGAIGDQVRYVGAIGAGTVAKLVHNCAGYILNCGLAEVFALGVKAGVDPLTLFESVRQGAVGRRRTFDGLIDQFLPNQYDVPAFALRLAHKDVALATALGRELGVPMRFANLTLEEMTEALNRGWADHDSRVSMLLELERAQVKIAVASDQLRGAIADDGATTLSNGAAAASGTKPQSSVWK